MGGSIHGGLYRRILDKRKIHEDRSLIAGSQVVEAVVTAISLTSINHSQPLGSEILLGSELAFLMVDQEKNWGRLAVYRGRDDTLMSFM